MVKCIRVPKNDAESVRSKLIALGLLDRDYRIQSDNSDVLIPILLCKFEEFSSEDVEMERIEHKETDYRNLLNMDVDLKEFLPSSFDTIGDVVVVKIPEEIIRFKNDIGKAIMDTTANVRIVMLDSGVKGELRIRELEQIAGSGTSSTIHTEFGVRMAVDPGKVYFNPRLATERKRIASMVKDHEIIVDMFAGVGPFPLVISKHANPEMIYSIDLNSDATEFTKQNIEMNKVKNITALNGDAATVMKCIPKADRIIMNLPQSATEFLDLALEGVKVGGMIHLHKILERSELEEFIENLTLKMRERSYEMILDNISELKTYSPTMSVYVFDIVRKG